jgi:pSer/pThr/pTyr-binding forkhead associated (FHA) protein
MTDHPTETDHTQVLSSRELDRAAMAIQAPAPGRYLAVRSGSEVVILPLRVGAVTKIGRGLTADVHLDDASISRRHARIVERSGRAVVLDDRSLNGTWVNGSRVDAAIHSDGDEIGVGRVVIRFLEVVDARGAAEDQAAG